MKRRISESRGMTFIAFCLTLACFLPMVVSGQSSTSSPIGLKLAGFTAGVKEELGNDVDALDDVPPVYEEKKRDGERGRRESRVPNYLAGRAERVKEYMTDWNKDWIPAAQEGGIFDEGGRLDGRRQSVVVPKERCVGIPQNLTLCRGIGYETMRLPNLLDHDTVKEATQQASSWVPLLNLHCHADTQMFLCSLFAPICLDRPILPCRSLCEAVRKGCETRMLKYGFPWPEMLRCEQFPLDNDLCIGVMASNKLDEEFCSACNQADTFENIVDQFCSADFAIIVKMDSVVVSGTDLKLVASTANRKILSAGGTSNKPKDLRDSVFYIEGGAKCSCNQLNTSDRSRGARTQTKINNSAARYLVMGQRRNGRLTVSFIQSADQKATDSSRVIADSTKRSSNEMGKALKSLRRGKDRICNQKGVQRIASTSNVIEPSRKRPVKKNEGKKKTVRKDGW